MRRLLVRCVPVGLLFVLAGCLGVPENIQPVEPFDAQRYLGEWYEIARLDHSFERGLTNVTANYSLREDGGVKVVNRGYTPEKKQWKTAEGKAYFAKGPGRGHLKVSFFGPFYGSYVVFDLDRENYQYSLVSGPDKSYFWLLSRTPKMDPDLQAGLIAKVKALGFDTSGLILVDQGSSPAVHP